MEENLTITPEEAKKHTVRASGAQLTVKFKKLVEDAKLPEYAHPDDAGMDITAVSMEYDEHNNLVYHTGLAMELPKGYMALIFPRSSNSKTNLRLTNCVGIVDSNYRGEILIKFRPDTVVCNPFRLWWNHYVLRRDSDVDMSYVSDLETNYKSGDKVAQLVIMPYPKVKVKEIKNLSKTDRGSGGFGSTGK